MDWPSAPALPSRLLAIADAGYLGESLVEKVCAAHRGGVEWVLLRGKELTSSVRGELAGELLERCPGLSLSVHSGPEVNGAWGLHLASERLFDGGGAATDSVLPMGYSCHDAAELRLAKAAGAAYCLLSPVFAPTSKSSYLPPLGWQGFEELAKGADGAAMPLYSLGGMTPERAAGAAGFGAAGVAVLGDLFGSDDVEARGAQWRKTVEDIFKHR